MDPVFTPATTNTLAVGTEISYGSVATLQDFWDVYVDTQNVGLGGQIEARLYATGAGGQKYLAASVGIAPVPIRSIGMPIPLPVCARETFKFTQSLVGVAGFRADPTRTGSIEWELRLVALNAQAAVSVRALLAGYSFSEPFGNDSIQTPVGGLTINPGTTGIVAVMLHQSEFHDLAADFSTIQEPTRFEIFSAAGEPTVNPLTQMVALVASADVPRGFSTKACTVFEGVKGVGAFAYAGLITNLGGQPITVNAVLNGYDSIGAGSGSSAQNLTQPTWFINAVTGSDANDGLTAGTALQTLHELTANRWGQGATLTPTGGIVNVFLDSDIPATDPLTLDVVTGEDVMIVFRGNAFTPIFAGALTAATPLNRAANQAATVTDALAPWAANTGQRIRNTTAGPRLNSIAGIARDLLLGVARISRPWITLLVGPAPGVPVFLSAGDFVALDTYVIEACPKMTVASVKLAGLPGVSGFQFPVINFLDLDIEADAFALGGYNCDAASAVQFFACRLPLVEIQGGTPSAYNNIFKDSIFRTDGVAGAAIFGGLILNPNSFFFGGGVGASMIYTFDLLVQSSLLQIVGVVLLDDVGVFDSPTDGIQTNTVLPFLFSESLALFGTAAVYGAGNTNVGFHMGTDALFIYSNAAVLTITGAAGDFECGAVGLLDTPDPANWNFTGAIAQTWANLTAARPGGFGGTVINPVNDARILPFFP